MLLYHDSDDDVVVSCEVHFYYYFTTRETWPVFGPLRMQATDSRVLDS